ncbi:MAG: carboxypeptidase-like regulatory domain-containing protein, partial [Vicinamibacterales bacterium]
MCRTLAILLASTLAIAHGHQATTQDVAIDPDDIGGVVTGPKGPEAGVWVIAETRDLPVRFIRIVVTDDRGRYVVPDLPRASYSVWARGYGLVDGAKVTAKPGAQVNLTATPAKDAAAAAQYYPAIYWYSMLKIPAADRFGSSDGLPANFTQTDWLNAMKSNGCVGCHQMGQLSTRSIPQAFGTFSSSVDAWRHRVQAGQSGQMMLAQMTALGPLAFQHFADWTDRIADGELPQATPSRPQGLERNIVVTLRD